MKLLKNKKGFSVVEVVIAMAVITIVTVTALSILTSAANNTREMMYKADAQYLVADAVECFKVSNSTSEFYEALNFRGNWKGASQSSDSVSIYIINGSCYQVTAITNYNDLRPTLNIEVIDNNRKIITEYSYTKAKR